MSRKDEQQRHPMSMERPREVAVDIKIDNRNRPEPEEPKKRKTSHGIVCQCGSEDVRVVTTQTRNRAYPSFMADRVAIKKRECKCKMCGAHWWQRTEIVERRIYGR